MSPITTTLLLHELEPMATCSAAPVQFCHLPNACMYLH